MVMHAVGCCHVSGLFVRHGWPLALMRSAGSGPYQQRVPEALGGNRVFPTLGSTDCALRLCHSAKLLRSCSYAAGTDAGLR